MSYPDLPHNTIILNGVDLATRFGMILLDGYTLSPPEPKIYTLDIPGSDGSIDLTTALTGDVAYSNRSQKFTFIIANIDDFEERKTKISNFLHGKSFDYKLTMDPDYTYRGRFTVNSYSSSYYAYPGLVGFVEVSIDAEPYKSKANRVYRMNAIGGHMYSFESGRKSVRPVIECSNPVVVSWNGTETLIPAGTWRLNDVLFTEGMNDLYINSARLYRTSWSMLSEGGENPKHWSDVADLRWDSLAMLGMNANEIPYKWGELYGRTWTEFAETPWSDLNWIPEDMSSDQFENYIVYLSYEWKDL